LLCGNLMSEDKPRDWRTICEELVQQKEKAKVARLLEELAAALEERAKRREERAVSDRK